MAVYVSNLVIPSGEDYEKTFTIKRQLDDSFFDLSDYSAQAHMKKHPESLNTTAIFEISFPDRQSGELSISLASSITSNIKPGRYSYDVMLYDGNKKKRAVEGSVLVTPGVTIYQ